MRFRKADIFFALLLAYFLIWGTVLTMPDFNVLNLGRLAMRYLLLAVMLETVLVLVGYLRGKPLFGLAKSTYFSWGRVVLAAVLVSALYGVLSWLALPSPVSGRQWCILAVLVAGGCIALMLYMYSLVRKVDGN